MNKSKAITVAERVHPDLKAVFSMMPALDLFSDIEKTRKMTEGLFKQMPIDPGIPILPMTIPGRENNPEVSVRVYKPEETDGDLPGLLYIHGGGYFLGFAAMSDALCQAIVREADCIVISVDYRLTPEHPYPAGLNDCYAALLWMADPQNQLGINENRLAVSGGSSGGGLAIAVALLARDYGGPPLESLLPLSPMLDDRNITPSSYEITDKRFWNRETNIRAWQMYLGENTKNVSPYAAPARATDVSGLPPTYISIGELDLFRDETIDFVTRLLVAGVSTEFHLYPGCFHGFEKIPQANISKRANEEYLLAIKNALKG